MPQYSGIYTLSQVAEAVKSQNWTNIPPPNVEYLVVAGGGGGGFSIAGGGGAGGLLSGITGVTSGSAITVTIGGGGSPDANGSNSVFGSITVTGGGSGGAGFNTPAENGSSGGSGGGAGSNAGGVFVGGAGINGQGNNGGRETLAGNYAGGGGGGAGTVGTNGGPVTNLGGNGGAGVASDISGARTTYAGGGGAGSNGTAGIGGAGGGGNGGAVATAGTANTGGGGGGGSTGAAGASGGSGIVIISYPDIFAPAVSTTGTPTVSTSGSGSLVFDGSGDYLTFPDNAAFDPASGDFTIECWVYHNAAGSTEAYFTSPTNGISFNKNSSNKLELSQAGVSTLATSTNNIPTGQWVHVAACRSSTTLRLFINGAQEASVTNTTNFTSNAGTHDVGGSGASFSMNGYITNLRLVKGTALYTSAFTVPTAPLTAVSGTSLLLSAVSGSQFSDSSGNAFTATVTGSTAWNQLSPFPTGAGFKNRVYRFTQSGSITF